MKNGFYFVDVKYTDFLKMAEIESRGFTTVPNFKYTNKDKFVYGTVLEISDFKYFVPVSSYDKPQQDNIIIKVKNHSSFKTVGSLRFNYMIPVPENCLTMYNFKDCKDEAYKSLLQHEYKFCLSKQKQIRLQAKKTYDRVIAGKDERLKKNSCDFALLEEKCKEWTDKNTRC